MKNLEAVFQRPLGMTFHKHRSWMWYTAMRHSGLEHLWEPFSECHNKGGALSDCLTTLRSVTSTQDWALLSRRLGVPVFKDRTLLSPSWYSRKGSDQAIWTKGGTWDRRNNFTKIIILNKGIRTRDHNFCPLTQKLTFRHCEQIEREVGNLVDPDALLFPDAIDKAVEYARWRLPSIQGKRHRASYRIAAWFFQTKVPHPHGGFVYPKQTVGYPRNRKKHGRNIDWRWLPCTNS